MERDEILQKLKSIISPYVKDPAALDDLSEETDFLADLKINSANLVDIVLDTEEAFSITIDNQAMERMLNVKATIAVIEEKLSEQ